MKINILDLIDFEKVDTLLEGFNKSTGFVTAILDLNGKVLSKSGWRQICTEFHRINPETSKKCTISDTELAKKLGEGEKYHFYKCLNGLVDVAVPVVINGEHIANLFSGQFFFEEPDRVFFKEQAATYGFNDKKYQEALENVPVVSKEKVLVAMDFLLNMTQLISETTYQKLEQINLNKTIRESEEKFKSVFESANVGKSITLPTGEIDVNEAFCKMLGYTRKELQNKKWQDLTPEEEIPIIQLKLEPLLKGEKESARFEKKYICKNGAIIWTDVSTSIRRDDNNKPLYFITTIIDITEQKKLEEQRRISEELFSDAFHIGPTGMTITRIEDGKFIDANESFCKLFEFERDEVIGHTSTDLKLWSPDERNRLIQQQIASGGLNNFELLARSKNGRHISILFSSKQMELRGEACLITTIIDITDRKQAEEALEKSEKFSKDVIDTMMDGFSILDKDGVHLDVNKSFSKMTGYNKEELIGIGPPHPYWPEEEFENIQKAFEKTAQGIIDDFELVFKKKNGERFPVIVSPSQLKDNKGNVISNFASIKDITERKKLETERQRFFMLAESSSEFIGMCDLELNPLYVNPAGRRMVGLPDMESACRVKVQDYYFPEDQQFIAEDFFPRILREGHGDVEIRLRHFQTGEAIWVYYYLFSIHDDRGKPIGWATVSRDITEKRRAEEALRKSEQEFRNLAESMPQIVWATRADGWNIYFNQQWIDYTGMTLEESYGHGWNKPFHPEDQQRAWDAWQIAVNSNGVYSIEARLRRYDGEYRWWLVRGVPLVDKNGSIQKWFGTYTDIEEMKQAEAEIQKLNAELEQRVHDRTIQLEASNKELETFTYSVSHDLKAPLRGIDGYSKLLMDLYKPSLNEEAQTFIETIRSSTLQMNQLIDDLLNYSLLERSHLNIEHIKIKDFIRSLVSIFKAELAAYSFKVDIEIEDIEIIADTKGLTIALRNLIENAIKFTKGNAAPIIHIKLEENNLSWIIGVTDNGIGFDMQYHQKIFEIFQRLHRVEDFPGTGVGLAMVNKAMQRMHGRAWVDSTPGKGSTFYLEIPKNQ